MNSLLKYLNENVELPEQLEEEQGGEYTYNTPYAFSKTPPSDKDKEKLRKRTSADKSYSERLEETIFKKIEHLNEVSYKDFVADDSKSNSQKINDTINEVNKNLYQLEMAIKRGMKLKRETKADQSIFWKSTRGKFSKIAERLNRINSHIREFST